MTQGLTERPAFSEEPVSRRPLQRELVDRVVEGLGERTQIWLAQEVRITQKHLSQLLSGRKVGSLDVWERLLRAVSQDDATA